MKYQVNTLYTLKLHNVIYQLHLNKDGGKNLKKGVKFEKVKFVYTKQYNNFFHDKDYIIS